MMVLSSECDSPLGTYEKAAVSSDAAYCSQIATDILKEGGSVADAAIGGLLCMGIIHSHSVGIGGGFLSVMHIAATGETEVLNARETAPLAATENMFAKNPVESVRGGRAVAIPGEMKGYWELYKRHGRLPWKRLFEPTIKLCRNGFKVTKTAAEAFVRVQRFILPEDSLSEIFVNPVTGELWKEGEIMTRPALANTLQTLADAPNGGDAFYEGPLADAFIADLTSFNGIMTTKDLKDYQVKWEEPIELEIYGGYKLKTVPVPGSGILLGFMLRVLGGHLPRPKSIEEYIRTYQRILETFKYTYAKRTLLGDVSVEDYTAKSQVEGLLAELKSEKFATEIRNLLTDTGTNNTPEYYGAEFYEPSETHGTGHISIVGPNGDAITVSSTINLHFGAKIRSKSTGIIFNNEMDDFSTPNVANTFGLPPAVNNYIKPHKRPMSSMCPSIFLDADGKVRLVIGATGGSKITTATALVSIYNLWFDTDVKKAIDQPRIHHQLFPMEASHEEGFNEEILDPLRLYGHSVTASSFHAIVCAVERNEDGILLANYDFRKSGSIDGF